MTALAKHFISRKKISRSKDIKKLIHQSQSAQSILATVESHSLDDIPKIFDYQNHETFSDLIMLNKTSIKVFLYPEESWAQNASTSYWILSEPFWWNRNKCKVTEMCGTKKYMTAAKIARNCNGSLFVFGSFKHYYNSEPHFKLFLSANVSPRDFNMGYRMTGMIERGSGEFQKFETTHFAVVKRKDIRKDKRF